MGPSPRWGVLGEPIAKPATSAGFVLIKVEVYPWVLRGKEVQQLFAFSIPVNKSIRELKVYIFNRIQSYDLSQ